MWFLRDCTTLFYACLALAGKYARFGELILYESTYCFICKCPEAVVMPLHPGLRNTHPFLVGYSIFCGPPVSFLCTVNYASNNKLYKKTGPRQYQEAPCENNQYPVLWKPVSDFYEVPFLWKALISNPTETPVFLWKTSRSVLPAECIYRPVSYRGSILMKTTNVKKLWTEGNTRGAIGTYWSTICSPDIRWFEHHRNPCIAFPNMFSGYKWDRLAV